MLHLIFESLWLWFLIGVVLWAFLGLLAASRQNMSPIVGIVVGGLFWFFGVAALLLIDVIRRSSRHASSGLRPESNFNVAAALPMEPGYHPAQDPWAASSSWPAENPVTRNQLIAARTDHAGVDEWGFPIPGYRGEPADAPGSPKRQLRKSQRRDLGITALALFGGVGMLVSLILPWGTGRIAWSNDQRHVAGAVTPASFGPVAALIGFTALIVLTCAFGWRRWPRGLWPGIAALSVTWWFTIVMEWVLVVGGASTAAHATNDISGSDSRLSFSTSFGAWLMLTCCAAVYAWCAIVAANLLRSSQWSYAPRQAAPRSGRDS